MNLGWGMALRWTALLLAGLFSSGALRAQSPDRLSPAELRELAAQKEIQRNELENLERETGRAVQLHNGAFFRRVYSDDFVGTVGFGQAMNKHSYITSMEGSNAKYVSMVVSDIRVRIYQDTAVVTALWSWRRDENGRTIGRQARVIHVYINGPRGWQAVASQETVLPG
jgi:hypothetical protein